MERVARLGIILQAMPAHHQVALADMHSLIQGAEAVPPVTILQDLVASLHLPRHAGHSLMAVDHAHLAIIHRARAAFLIDGLASLFMRCK